jgi:hypothetical protein
LSERRQENERAYISVKSDAFPENPLNPREFGGICGEVLDDSRTSRWKNWILTAEGGRVSLLDVINVLHSLHARARGRGICGSGRVFGRAVRGTGGRRRGRDPCSPTAG